MEETGRNEMDTAREEIVRWDEARKSSRSNGDSMCVEMAPGEGVVGFQDSKDRTARLAVTAGVAAAFLADVKTGRYDI